MGIEPSGFREVARSATTSYPIPFLFALCLAFAVLSLGGALIADAALRWVFVAFAGISLFFGCGIVMFAVLRRPRLLRSERHEVVGRILDMMGGDNLTPQTIDEIGRVILDERRSKPGRVGGGERK